MRKLAVAFIPLFLLSAMIACDDESSSGPPFDVGDIDANIPPANPIDGSAPDASPDADPPTPAVSVTVHSLTGPRAGVRIVWNDAQGNVIDSKLTGADGTATHEGTDAVMVSALLPRVESRHIVTWTNVEVGENLQLLDPGDPAELGTYTVTLPNTEPDAFQYFVHSSCGEQQTYGTAAVIYNDTTCARPTNSVLVTAFKNNDGTPTYYRSFKKANPTPPEGNANITSGPWAVAAPVSLNLQNFPDDVGRDLDVLEISDNHGFRAEYWEGHETPNTFVTAPGFADALQGAAYTYNLDAMNRQRVIARRAAPATATLSLDYDQLLPEITDASIDTTNPVRPVLSWEGTTTETDGGLVRVWFSNETFFSNYWSVIVRPGSSTVTIPALPAEASEFMPYEESTFGSPAVIFVESDQLPGYKELRTQQGLIFGAVEENAFGFRLPALPANGLYRATTWAELPR